MAPGRATGRKRDALDELQGTGDLPHERRQGASAADDGADDNAPRTTPHDPARGNPANPGIEVPRQFLEVLTPGERKPFTKGSGRLELARAIASKDNPLTARVMVNRVWQHHFGKGLVTTPGDFGLRGEQPTHPELLDWLAASSSIPGWSIKALHRLIAPFGDLSAVVNEVPEAWPAIRKTACCGG